MNTTPSHFPKPPVLEPGHQGFAGRINTFSPGRATRPGWFSSPHTPPLGLAHALPHNSDLLPASQSTLPAPPLALGLLDLVLLGGFYSPYTTRCPAELTPVPQPLNKGLS